MITGYIDTYSNGNFSIVDMGDTDVIIKETLKDLQDISKVFSPYSLDITLPPTDNNKRLLDWFGYNDVEVSSVNKNFRFPFKIYVNDILHLNGFFSCKGMTVGGDFTGKFETGMTSLKDRMGEALISELPIKIPISWGGVDVQKYMSSVQTINQDGTVISYFVPLSSNSRFWFRDETLSSDITNNIAYKDGAYNKDTAINTAEVSIAMSYYSLLKLIIKYYDLDIFMSPSIEPILSDMYISCCGDKYIDMDFEKIKITKPFNALGDRHPYTLVYYPHTYHTSGGTLSDPYLKIQNRTFSKSFFGLIYKSKNKYISVEIYLNGVITSSTNVVSAVLKDLQGNQVAQVATAKLDNGSMTINLKILDTTFQSLGETDLEGEFEKFIKFNIFLKSIEPISWSTMDLQVIYDRVLLSGAGELAVGWRSSFNDNFPSFRTKASTIDLFKSLPKMKVSDFLSSFFKMFNISVFDNDPLNDKLQWLTPSDINTIDKEYSKKEVDYTKYVIDRKVNKNKEDDYDAYTFKHKKSKLISNEQFEAAYGEEFGAVYYPTIIDRRGVKINKELKVETSHVITGNVSINGMEGVFTFYGFDSSSKKVNEPLIFFIERNAANIYIKTISDQKLAIQNVKSDNSIESIPLSQYIPVNTDRKANGIYTNSLTFSGTTVAENSLYKLGYESFVSRLLDFKALEHKFKLQIPLSEIYLNKELGSVTPSGYRLQNDIIIEENRYSIINSEMNIKNGMLNLSLYNYTIQNKGILIPRKKQFKINQFKNTQFS